ncbi:ABC transporter permease [Methylococcaceae bacterium WWC4]|nr:ABC transporter permease [Methylococcaceae bacterium WWC4]
MNVLRYKILADWRAAKARSLLAVVNIAIGIFCVGTLFGMIALLLDRMDAAHRRSQPSHINLILRGAAEPELLSRLRAIPGVAGIDTMTPLSVRYRQTGSDEWQNATLILRPDYAAQQFDLTTLESGSWPGVGQVAVENLSQQATGLTTGAMLEFDTANGPTGFRLSGVVRHPFVKPPKFGGQIHFFADRSSAASFGVADGYFRQLLVRIVPPYDAETARGVAAQLRNLLAERHLPVSVTLLQDPEKHWGRPFVAGINSVLQAMALASLALASLLILNTVSAQITQQTDQIGVIKALGGGGATVAGLYLSEVALLAVAATCVAIPPALFGADWAARKLLALFNIAGGAFSVAPDALAWMIGGGLLAPLLAALPPVWRGATMTVRTALASYGLGGDFGGNRFDAWIEKLGARWLPTLYAAALGNLFRRKARLLLTQGVLIVAGIMFLVSTSLIASVNLTLDNEMARSRYAVKLGFSFDQPAAKVAELAKSLPATRDVAVWQRLPVEISHHGQTLRQTGSLGLQMLAVPAASTLYRPLIEAGRWLADAGERELVISADTAALNGLKPGDSVDVKLGVRHDSWRVAGVYRWLAGNNPAVEPVYAPQTTARELAGTGELASFALLDADIADAAGEDSYLRQLKDRYDSAGLTLDVYSTEAKLAQRRYARNQFNSVLGTLAGLAAMVAVIGGIGLSGTLTIAVLQRTREIGVMRAIGAPTPAVFRLFAMEGLLHGSLAWLISVPMAWWLARPLAERLGTVMLGIRLDYRFDYTAALYWLVLVLAIAAIAAYWPAKSAAKLTIRDCLAH